jgi:hypothetical protein
MAVNRRASALVLKALIADPNHRDIGPYKTPVLLPWQTLDVPGLA